MLVTLAEHAPGEPHLFGWWLGLGIGFAIVWVVVIVVSAILSRAARIAKQAQEILVGLDQGRQTTLPLWDIDSVNATAKAILERATEAREALEAQA
ncbi:MAG TPA: hypothetical protein VM324_16930 [Egibacteraceae bacterium]|nr:hypothetical protein [Egibacteraceae bacterium]